MIEKETVSVLIIKDEKTNIAFLITEFQKHPTIFSNVSTIHNTVKAFDFIRVNKPAMIIIDTSLQDAGDGCLLIEQIRTYFKNTTYKPFIAVTAHTMLFCLKEAIAPYTSYVFSKTDDYPAKIIANFFMFYNSNVPKNKHLIISNPLEVNFKEQTYQFIEQELQVFNLEKTNKIHRLYVIEMVYLIIPITNDTRAKLKLTPLYEQVARSHHIESSNTVKTAVLRFIINISKKTPNFNEIFTIPYKKDYPTPSTFLEHLANEIIRKNQI